MRELALDLRLFLRDKRRNGLSRTFTNEVVAQNLKASDTVGIGYQRSVYDRGCIDDSVFVIGGIAILMSQASQRDKVTTHLLNPNIESDSAIRQVLFRCTAGSTAIGCAIGVVVYTVFFDAGRVWLSRLS